MAFKAFQPPSLQAQARVARRGPRQHHHAAPARLPSVRASKLDTQQDQQQTLEQGQQVKTEAQLTTEKLGLEAGLFKVMTSSEQAGQPSRTEQAKQLLTQYGSAYLITSISFAIISFAMCYIAVDAGVDIATLVGKLGLEVTSTSESVGTVALAYAAHKALSPLRFPPTVALTPVVAKWLGKGKDEKKP